MLTLLGDKAADRRADVERVARTSEQRALDGASDRVRACALSSPTTHFSACCVCTPTRLR
jgi:hypothetical protein